MMPECDQILEKKSYQVRIIGKSWVLPIPRLHILRNRLEIIKILKISHHIRVKMLPVIFTINPAQISPLAPILGELLRLGRGGRLDMFSFLIHYHIFGSLLTRLGRLWVMIIHRRMDSE